MAAGTLIGRQVFNTAGTTTYTPTVGAKKAIVRGSGGGGGGGGTPTTNSVTMAAASGGNSGTSIEVEINPGGALTGGSLTVGAGGVGGTNANGNVGSPSTLVIGGVTLNAPGGSGGIIGVPVNVTSGLPFITNSPPQNLTAAGVDYQASDLGSPGIIQTQTTLQAGNGGSGDFGVGGGGQNSNSTASLPAIGNGAGGGGSTSPIGTPANQKGGNGAPGIWIIEEYT